MADETAATNVWCEFYVEDADTCKIDLHTMATDMAAEIETLRAKLSDVTAERNALQEEMTKLIATANHNAALSIAELRESMRLPQDEPVQGRCANCGEWHPIADMWAECTACFDETVAKQAKAELADVQNVEAWKASGALRALSSPSHDGTQMWSAYEWRDGATSATVVASADSLAALGRALEGA